MSPPAWDAHLALWRPRRMQARLAAAVAVGWVARAPNLLQVQLGVLRRWWRSLTRPQTIGTSTGGRVRDQWRARLLALRPL